MFVKLTLSLALLLAPIIGVTQEVYQGSWPDGTSLAWQCQKGAEGSVKFMFKLQDGKTYAGELSCGKSV